MTLMWANGSTKKLRRPLLSFPFIGQTSRNDCGLACISMIASYYGKAHTIDSLAKLCTATDTGISMLELSKAAEAIGFKTLGVSITFELLEKAVKKGPSIVHWYGRHYVVVYLITETQVYIADPAAGLFAHPKDYFERCWKSENESGYCLVLEPGPEFKETT